MKKTVKFLAASTFVCLLAVGLSTNSNSIKKNSNSIDLLSFSLKSAQAHGEGSDHNHGPCSFGLGGYYCKSTNLMSCPCD
ncbi:hypothetical protein [Flavivirga jejuensis]|uniref:Uncharacterized protein n=1 Tax=Flavivirga jejuensis TaxID=870487 RepID=A0ABT8WRV0_9FLAO|nr:hypothetical protein [Flavivirga jejuensis]MDO5975932.1 hypothetical protein [Flavivirga jejuensis]